MTPQDAAVTSLSTLVSLAGLLWLLYWGFRTYRIDNFRFQLFSLRAELFDLARKNDIGFDAPAYAQLRGTLNGFLRFADRLTLLSSVIIARDINRMIERGEAVLVKSEWDKAVEELEPGVAVQLKDLRARMHVAVFEQIIFSSPMFVATLIPFLLAALVRFVGRSYVWAVFAWIYQRLERWFERAVRPLDTYAFELGTSC